MPGGGREDRRHTRLVSQSGLAHSFFGERAADLPRDATVIDVSAGGVRLAFTWPADRMFPLGPGDRLGLHLALEGAPGELNVLSLVRRIEIFEDIRRVEVGVEFSGLGEREKETVRRAVERLALAKLKGLRPKGAARLPAGRGGGPPGEATAEGPSAAPAAPSTLEITPDGRPAAPSAPPRPPAAQAPSAPSPPASSARSASSGPSAPPAPGGTTRRRRKPYLGQVLVQQGAISSDRLERFLEEEFTGRKKLGEELRELGLVDEVAVARALAQQARLPFEELGGFEVAKLAGTLPRLIFIEHKCAPLREEQDGDVLVVGMARPPTLDDVEKLSSATAKRIRVAIVTEADLGEALENLYNIRTRRKTGQARFQVSMDVAYRFCDRDWNAYVGGPSVRGTTQDISRSGLLLVGGLPLDVTPELIEAEDLRMEVRVQASDFPRPFRLSCKPTRVDPQEDGALIIGCRIEGFPSGDEADWGRLCMVIGMRKIKPGMEAFE